MLVAEKSIILNMILLLLLICACTASLVDRALLGNISEMSREGPFAPLCWGDLEFHNELARRAHVLLRSLEEHDAAMEEIENFWLEHWPGHHNRQGTLARKCGENRQCPLDTNCTCSEKLELHGLGMMEDMKRYGGNSWYVKDDTLDVADFIANHCYDPESPPTKDNLMCNCFGIGVVLTYANCDFDFLFQLHNPTCGKLRDSSCEELIQRYGDKRMMQNYVNAKQNQEKRSWWWYSVPWHWFWY